MYEILRVRTWLSHAPECHCHVCGFLEKGEGCKGDAVVHGRGDEMRRQFGVIILCPSSNVRLNEMVYFLTCVYCQEQSGIQKTK